MRKRTISRTPVSTPAQLVLLLITVLLGILVSDRADAGILEGHADSYQWRLCPATRFIPLQPGYTDDSIDRKATEIRSDTSRLVKDGLSQFTGDVEVVQGKRSLRADMVTYDPANDLFFAEGRTHIWETGITWSGQSAAYDLNSEVSVLEHGQYWVQSGRGRGSASQISNDRNADVTTLENVDYTTCPLSGEDWQLSATKLKLNHKSDRGSARNAVLRVRGVPVFYFPYVYFPTSDERKSGFLAPYYGSTNESGFDVRTPYYWNIAPNYDATITPRYIQDRGAMLGVQARYRTRESDGQLEFEYLPGDDLKDGEDRSLVSLRHHNYFHERRGEIALLLNNVSDDRYFEDLGNALSVTSRRFLDRRVNLKYKGNNNRFVVQALAQGYQSVDENIPGSSEPYRRLPQIHLYLFPPSIGWGINAYLATETTYFYRPESVTAGRIDIEPVVSRPFKTEYLSIEPRMSIRHTQYLLDDPAKIFDDNESRTVPVFSVDSKLFLERKFSLFGKAHVQTLEPRIFYVLTPHVGQDDIPHFDSGLYQVSFRNLFQYNRYAGRDRVGDANQVTLALTTRALDAKDGRETFRFSIGQIFYFRDREVTLAGSQPEEARDRESEIVAEAAMDIGGDLSARGTIHWEPDESRAERAAVNLRYRPRFDTVLNLGYSFRRLGTDVKQTDVSLRWPVTDRWTVVGRWNYSLREKESLETIWGVEYESCCWGLRLVGRRFLLGTNEFSELEYENGIFAQVHFRGLGGFGQNATSLLRRGISGYADPFD